MILDQGFVLLKEDKCLDISGGGLITVLVVVAVVSFGAGMAYELCLGK